MPRSVRTRVVLHTCATASGAALAVGLWPSGLLMAVAAYVSGFVGFHVLLCPLYSMWLMFAEGLHRYVQGVVEEELIRYDMKTYDRQLQRILPDPLAKEDGSRQA